MLATMHPAPLRRPFLKETYKSRISINAGIICIKNPIILLSTFAFELKTSSEKIEKNNIAAIKTILAIHISLI